MYGSLQGIIFWRKAKIVKHINIQVHQSSCKYIFGSSSPWKPNKDSWNKQHITLSKHLLSKGAFRCCNFCNHFVFILQYYPYSWVWLTLKACTRSTRRIFLCLDILHNCTKMLPHKCFLVLKLFKKNDFQMKKSIFLWLVDRDGTNAEDWAAKIFIFLAFVDCSYPSYQEA